MYDLWRQENVFLQDALAILSEQAENAPKLRRGKLFRRQTINFIAYAPLAEVNLLAKRYATDVRLRQQTPLIVELGEFDPPRTTEQKNSPW